MQRSKSAKCFFFFLILPLEWIRLKVKSKTCIIMYQYTLSLRFVLVIFFIINLLKYNNYINDNNFHSIFLIQQYSKK